VRAGKDVAPRDLPLLRIAGPEGEDAAGAVDPHAATKPRRVRPRGEEQGRAGAAREMLADQLAEGPLAEAVAVDGQDQLGGGGGRRGREQPGGGGRGFPGGGGGRRGSPGPRAPPPGGAPPQQGNRQMGGASNPQDGGAPPPRPRGGGRRAAPGHTRGWARRA